jgi:pimeloyl-ACP methyl ester carboxylesterase
MQRVEERAPDGVWAGLGPDGVLVARPGEDGSWLVDRPGTFRFRDRTPAPWQDGQPVVDGVRLRPVGPLPQHIDRACGWYEDGARRILLTQIPEAYFGEPMLLVVAGDRISRGYPLDEGRLLVEDGTELTLDADARQLRAVAGERAATMHRIDRWPERPVRFDVGGGALHGTLITPDSPAPHPAAVLLHGAAGGQRDFCRIQAEALLEAGVAVLLYDKPGHGESAGPDDPSIFDQAHAAEAAMRALAEIPEVDGSRIGLAGFSNGMWSAPMVAARSGAAFLVGVGSPGVTMAESEVHRRTKVLRDVGVSEPTLDAVAEAWRSLFAIVARGAAPQMVARLGAALQAASEAPDLGLYDAPGYVQQNPMLSPIPPLLRVDQLVPMLEEAHDPQLAHDPAPDYARIECPVFLQYGSLDTSVPVRVSVERISAAAERAGRGCTIRVYPGLEHMLNVPSTRLVGLTPEDAMYRFHDFAFGPGVWAELAGWLRENVSA